MPHRGRRPVGLGDIILDNVVERGRCDFVRDISAELPLQAVADVMGIPVEGRAKVCDWSNALIGRADPDFIKTRETSSGPRPSCSATPTNSRRSAAARPPTTSSPRCWPPTSTARL